MQHLKLMEGYLLKRKSKGGFGALGYCKRYFVLNNISLLYSNSSDDTEVNKIIQYDMMVNFNKDSLSMGEVLSKSKTLKVIAGILNRKLKSWLLFEDRACFKVQLYITKQALCMYNRKG